MQEELLATAVELRAILHTCLHEQGHCHPLKSSLQGKSCLGLGVLEKGPGLLGFVAKHFPRADELEYIWDRRCTKNKVGRTGRETSLTHVHDGTQQSVTQTQPTGGKQPPDLATQTDGGLLFSEQGDPERGPGTPKMHIFQKYKEIRFKSRSRSVYEEP